MKGETPQDNFEVEKLLPENYEPVGPEIARQEVQGQILKIDDLKKTYENGF